MNHDGISVSSKSLGILIMIRELFCYVSLISSYISLFRISFYGRVESRPISKPCKFLQRRNIDGTLSSPKMFELAPGDLPPIARTVHIDLDNWPSIQMTITRSQIPGRSPR
jgi:hypothetical protein